jgi:hypothetical protein
MSQSCRVHAMPAFYTRPLATVLLLAITLTGHGQTFPQAEVVLEDLDTPCGVAVQPETGHVFVSDSGRGRVVRVVDGKLQEVVVGFALEHFGADPGYRIGPLGLAFLNTQTLVIGGGGQPLGEDVVFVVQVPTVGGEPIQSDAAMRFGPLPADPDGAGEGDFFGVAATAEAIVVTCHGDDQNGWLAAIPIRKSDQLDSRSGYGHLTKFLPTKSLVGTDAPVAIVVSPRGELVVGHMGELNDQRDSRLTFFRKADGKLLLNQPLGLFDVVALAYGAPQAPSHKPQLYALDFAGYSAESAGLYRLDARLESGSVAVQAVQVASLDRPTAMALGPDGAMYVTVIGTEGKAGPQRPGKLMRFDPGL